MTNRSKLLNITPEDRQRMIDKRIEKVKSTTMEYQIGWYVGQLIFDKYLPCLDVDMIHTNQVIYVTPEESAEAKRLNDIWYENCNSDIKAEDDPWMTLRAYHKELENKYLPKELKCHVDPINVIDIEEFKKGLRTSLWNCDICHYNIRENSDIDVAYDEDYYFTVITLMR
jgi:hypothetical protein